MSYKTQIECYIKANKMRRTPERNKLIDCLDSMKEFNVSELLNYAAVMEISKASVYNFINLLDSIGIIKEQEKYVFNLKNKNL